MSTEILFITGRVKVVNALIFASEQFREQAFGK